jgi:glucosyl-dolichyl phosphate glucuronosyltransferase
MLISVIIATYNRCESLRGTLDSLLAQEEDGGLDYEVLAVDNNSRDKTREVVESYMPGFRGKLRYLFEPRQGKGFALNQGIKEAKGEIVVFTDDDVIADKGWLVNIRKCFQELNCDGMGGRILPLYPAGTPEWIKDNRDILSGPIVCHDYGEESKLYKKYEMLPFVGANLAIRKTCLESSGFFRPDMGTEGKPIGEDTELFWRLQNSGKRIFYCGKSLIWHKVDKKRMNWVYIAKWYVASGRYQVKKNNSKEDLPCYFGVPRYLIKDFLKRIIFFIASIFRFNRREILKSWNLVFHRIGMILEYRKIYA